MPITRQPLRKLPVVEAKPTRAADFRGLSDEDIIKEVEQSKLELFRLRFQQARKEVRPLIQLVWLCCACASYARGR